MYISTSNAVCFRILKFIITSSLGACFHFVHNMRVKLREAHPALRQRIEIRRGDFAAIASGVGEAQVIGENDQDIRVRRCRGSGREGQCENGEREEGGAHSEWEVRRSRRFEPRSWVEVAGRREKAGERAHFARTQRKPSKGSKCNIFYAQLCTQHRQVMPINSSVQLE